MINRLIGLKSVMLPYSAQYDQLTSSNLSKYAATELEDLEDYWETPDVSLPSMERD